MSSAITANRLTTASRNTPSGLDGLLAGLDSDQLRWNPPVVELARPVQPAPETGSSTISAAAADGFWSAAAPRGLSGLLGTTRATVLAAAAGGGSTALLARRAGISLPSASQHTAVLRDAGLLVTERRGPSVQHSLSDLGVRLLNRQL